MQSNDFVGLLRDHRYAVVATIGPAGEPQAAIVGIAVTDRCEVVFDALPDSRKAMNVHRDARTALVVLMDDRTCRRCWP